MGDRNSCCWNVLLRCRLWVLQLSMTVVRVEIGDCFWMSFEVSFPLSWFLLWSVVLDRTVAVVIKSCCWVLSCTIECSWALMILSSIGFCWVWLKLLYWIEYCWVQLNAVECRCYVKGVVAFDRRARWRRVILVCVGSSCRCVYDWEVCIDVEATGLVGARAPTETKWM